MRRKLNSTRSFRYHRDLQSIKFHDWISQFCQNKMPRGKSKSPKRKSPANKSKSGKSSPAGSSPSRITASTPKIKHVDLPEELKFSDIKISVSGFENMNPKHKVTEIIVQAEFMGVVIGESPQQPLSDDAFVDYHFNCVLRYFPDNPKSIQDLLGNPIIFNVFDTEGKKSRSRLSLHYL